MAPDTNGWSTAELHVMETLKTHSADIKEIHTTVARIDKRLAVMWVKVSGIIAVATAIATLVAKSWAGP